MNNLHFRPSYVGKPTPIGTMKLLIVMCIALTASCQSHSNSDPNRPKLLFPLGTPPANQILWSPVDEDKVLVSAGIIGFHEAEVYILDVNSGAKNLIASTSHGMLGIRDWSPDGKYVIIYADRGSAGFESGGLWKIDVANHKSSFIRDDANAVRWDPTSGRMIIDRSTTRDDGTALNQLVSVDLETKVETVMFEAPPTKVILGFSVSSDSGQIALAMGSGGADANFNIYTIDATSKALTELTHDGGYTSPAWSPHSSIIAYRKKLEERGISRYSIELINQLSGCVVKVYTADYLLSPTWSPGGNALALIEPNAGGIFVVDTDKLPAAASASSGCQ